MLERFLILLPAALPLLPGPLPEKGTIQVPLRFLDRSRGGRKARFFLPSGVHYLEKSLRPPRQAKRLPSFLSSHPVFLSLTLAGKKHLLVLDQKDRKSPFFDRLYFDSDADGDLAEEKPLDTAVPKARGSFLSASFSNVRTTLDLPGGKVPYVFRLFAYLPPVSRARRGKEGRLWGRSLADLRVYASPACAYQGSFRLGGKTYQILLADGNVDGWFGSPREVPVGYGRKRGDQVYLARDRKVSYRDGIQAQDLLGLGDRLFRFRFDQVRALLRLLPVEGTTAKVTLGMPLSRLVLASPGKGPGIMWFDPAPEITLPPGTYRLTGYQALRKDDGGNEWILVARAPSRNGPAFTARAGGTVDFPLGEPFTAEVKVTARFPRKAPPGTRANAYLRFLLTGRAGEIVADLRSMTYRKSKVPRSKAKRYRPKEPVYKIVELPSLAVAAQGSFHYG